jgi:hypothetical protein
MRPRLLCYPDLSSQIARRPTFNPAAHSFPDIFSKVVHPYDPDAFERLLTKHDLLSAYPLLAHQLRHGFPLGTFPAIQRTVIHPNPPFPPISTAAIYKYIDKEVTAGRTSGPYSPMEVESILRGPFVSSPFTVAFQPQGPDLPDKIRVCRNLSKASKSFPSANSFIDKDDYLAVVLLRLSCRRAFFNYLADVPSSFIMP